MHLYQIALRMFRRDLRAGELHLLFIAILVAVTSLTSVSFLADRVGRSLEREASQLLGGDLLLRADHPWPAAMTEALRQRPLQSVRSVTFNSMLMSADDTRLVGVKAAENGYPLRGGLRIAAGPGMPDRDSVGVPAQGEIWVDEQVMGLMNLHVGDQVELGLLQLKVSAMITFESDRGTNFFSLLPRVIINHADLPASGLLVEGARAVWRLHVAGDDAAVADFQRWVKPRLERGESLESIDNARPELRRNLDQAQRFLRLAALLAVVLAAVAVGLGSRRFMLRHLDACAVMRCLGASRRHVVSLFMGEFLLLATLASVAGIALGWLIQSLLGGLVASLIAAHLPTPSLMPLLHGLLVGLLLIAGFALPQLLRLGKASTLRLLRREGIGFEPFSLLAWLAAGSALLVLVIWLADDLRLGLVVGLGFALALGLYALFSAALILTLARGRRLAGSGGNGWRYGLASLRRRLGGSVIQASALGIGLTALLLLSIVRSDLTQAWYDSIPADAPNRFIVNIQPDQEDGLRDLFRRHGLAVPPLSPMIRGRLMAINGRAVKPADYVDERAQRQAEREFNLSYGTHLQTGNEVVAGQWHGEDPAPAFSVEEGIARRLGIQVGDRLRFQVAGEEVEAPVSSVRRLSWDSMQVNFFVVSSPAVLQHQRGSLITSFHLPPGQEALTRALLQAYPNLTVIDVGAILGQLQQQMERLALVVQFIFVFAVLAGLVVLYAALQSTHDERRYELAMLRTLGARNAQVRQSLLAEFSLLGGIAGVLAGLGAGSIGWVLATQVFHLEHYVPAVTPVLVGALAGGGLVLLGGWFGVRKLLRSAPLASLRMNASS